MSIRWDPVLVRHLAGELDELLSGTHLRAVQLDGTTRDLVLLFRERTVLWRLHPARGGLLLFPPRRPPSDALKVAAGVRTVRAPADERLLHIELVPARGGRSVLDLRVELLGNQWNAVVTEEPGSRIRHVLVRRRGTRAAEVGGTYEAPRPLLREGREGTLLLERWLELLEPLSPESRAGHLVRAVAWTSPLNAAALLGAATHASGDEGRRALEEAWARWQRIASGAQAPRPGLLETEHGPQPYPFPLPGVPFREADSLLEAFAQCGEGAGDGQGDQNHLALLPSPLLAELEEALDTALRRTTRLLAESEGLEDPEELRAQGNLLLARYGEVPKGAESIRLPGFDGVAVTIPLDPSLAPHENASRLFDRAGRVERARLRLPELVERARLHAARLEDVLERARRGDATEDEIRVLVPARRRPSGKPSRGVGEPLPYRRWRSSGGLEIRVGKGAKQNDDLTFHHSAPGDVWLHARHASGAHVVLRWSGPGNPPHKDLTEAAVLAALNSGASTSGSVPVDWTFRKYVRKPRGSPPGRVVVERARTLFVKPDPEVADRLALDQSEEP